MEISIVDIIKFLLTPALIVGIGVPLWSNRLSIIREAPKIFVKQITMIDDFKRLSEGFKCRECYFLRIYSIRNCDSGEENVSTEFEKVYIEKIKIDKNMLYINIMNKDMHGAELKILDNTGKSIRLSDWEHNYLCEKQKVGVFIDFYCRPSKILVIYQGNRFEYDIYSSDGAIKARLKGKKR